MGWALGDQKKVEESRVHLSRTRSAFYVLDRAVQSIQHEEKRETMRVELKKISESLDHIEKDLHR